MYNYNIIISVTPLDICKFIISASILLYQPKVSTKCSNSTLCSDLLRFAILGIIYAMHNIIISNALVILLLMT